MKYLIDDSPPVELDVESPLRPDPYNIYIYIYIYILDLSIHKKHNIHCSLFKQYLTWSKPLVRNSKTQKNWTQERLKSVYANSNYIIC